MLNDQNGDNIEKTNSYKDVSNPLTDYLISEVQSGDRTVLPLLVEQCIPILERIAYRYYRKGGHGLRGYEQDDLFQEACLMLVEAIGGFSKGKGLSFNQYVSLCVENHFKKLNRRGTAMKRQTHMDAVSLEGLVEESGYQVSGYAHAYSPEQVPIIKETMDQMISKLSSFEREVYTYHYFGYSYDEIAMLLNCNRSQVARARNRCTKKFKEHFPEYT